MILQATGLLETEATVETEKVDSAISDGNGANTAFFRIIAEILANSVVQSLNRSAQNKFPTLLAHAGGELNEED